MSLFFNMLSWLVLTFLPRRRCLLISWLKSLSAVILEPPKNKVSHCFHCFCISLPWSDGTGCHGLVFWILNFKPLSSFTFLKRLFSSSLLSAVRVVPSAYLRLLIFLPAILIPACASSSPAFLMMYSAYELNNLDDTGEGIGEPLQYSCLENPMNSMPSMRRGRVGHYKFLFRDFEYHNI